jgi:hypothetical protein
MKSRYVISLATGLALVGGLALALPAFAQTNPNNQNGGPMGGSRQGWSNGEFMGHRVASSTLALGGAGYHGAMGVRFNIEGTVTAISGTTLTVSGHQGMMASTTTATTYTVDASNAKVFKTSLSSTTTATPRPGITASTLSSVAVGDTLQIQGKVSGTSVTANSIVDGRLPARTDNHGPAGATTKGQKTSHTPSTPTFAGNGQPVIAGTVTAISGSTLTVTTSSSSPVVYSVDASSAKVLQGPTTIALSSVAINDHVVVQGTVSGTSVTASTVIDQTPNTSMGDGRGATTTAPGDQGQQQSGQQKPHGFFQNVSSFFSHLF